MIDSTKVRHAFPSIVQLVVLLLAFYLRMRDVGNWPVRMDEAFSVWAAQMDFFKGTEFTASDVHPPIYFWLLHMWARMTGSSEFAIRSLSVFPSLITVSVVYAITLRLSRRRLSALLAMLLTTMSPYLIHWAQDTRMYPLATMFASLTIYAHLRTKTRLFAIAGIATALTHYFGAIVVGILAVHELLLGRHMGPRRRQWCAAIACILAVCMLWGAYAIGLIRKDPSFATFDPQAAFLMMAGAFSVNSSTHQGAYNLHVALVTAVFFLGLFFSWRDSPRATLFVLLGCLLPPAIISLLGLPFVPVHVNALQARYFNLFAPFVFAGFGLGLTAMLRRRWLRLVGAISGLGLLIFYASLALERADGRYFKDDYRSMMQAVAALTTEHDRVYFTSGGRKPLVYYHLDRVGYGVQRNALAEPENVTGIPTSSHGVSDMMQWVFAGVDRFWLIEIEAHHDQPPNARIDWINENYHQIYHIPVAWNGISFYSKYEDDAIPDIALIVEPVVAEARPGDQVRIGAPAGAVVDLVHSGQVIDTRVAETWMLHEFDIYPFYFNGFYELRVGDERYPFVITHSRDFPGTDG